MITNKLFPVTCSTQNIAPEGTYVAIRGHSIDGHHFIPKAIERGAKTIVVDKKANMQKLQQAHPSIIFEQVANTRQELALRSAQALKNPAEKLTIIGITGTKGKSTCTFLTHHLLSQSGYKAALLSGIYNKILDEQEASRLTTESADYLHMFFAECVKQGLTHVVMEVSSHALSLYRTYGITFAAVGFTNLEREHLDYYPSMEKYFAAKCLLFKQVKAGGSIVINGDDAWGLQATQQLLTDDVSQKIVSFFQKNQNIIPSFDPGSMNKIKSFSIKSNSLDGLTLTLNNTSISCPQLFGEFNAYNITMAALLAQSVGITANAAAQAVATFSGTPGRLQLHTLRNGAKAFVDFAHNASGMKAVLKALRPLTHHLIVVFGCGGDRDKGKRPAMGALARQYADEIIVTDDNLRTEKSHVIIDDILTGISNHNNLTVLADRKKAIAHAVKCSTPGSVIALLGKGHEEYYLVGNKKIYFSDREEILQY